MNNGITGEHLVDLGEDELADCFEAVGVTNKFHRKTISSRLRKKFGDARNLSQKIIQSKILQEESNEEKMPAVAKVEVKKALRKTEEKSSPRSYVKNERTTAFLTHDWGTNEDGTDNHELVARVNRYLQKNGIVTWFDEDRMKGDTQYMMADGIDNTQCLIVFMTKRYLQKINLADVRDNCCFEFGYALRQLGSTKMLPVVVEQRMKNPNLWKGKGGAALGGLLYTDLTNHFNESAFEKTCRINLQNKRFGSE